jgi:hypothetical protein
MTFCYTVFVFIKLSWVGSICMVGSSDSANFLREGAGVCCSIFVESGSCKVNVRF